MPGYSIYRSMKNEITPYPGVTEPRPAEDFTHFGDGITGPHPATARRGSAGALPGWKISQEAIAM